MEKLALECEQELCAWQKEGVKDSSFTIHSNRPDVRLMNGALYPITDSTQMGFRMRGFNKIEGMVKSRNFVVFQIHAKHSVGMATAACTPW